ncbi:MAG: hypothetical protein WHS65_11645 [Melioribacteraceae bacterium]
MQKNIFNNWSIEKGDYKRDESTTWRYQKKLQVRRTIKKILLIILYCIVVAGISFLIFSD